jgi:probable rRNA maturation factor
VLSFAHDTEDSINDDDGERAGNHPAQFVLPPALANEPRYLGDIALSYERVRTQAAAYEHSEQHELTFLVVHAVLHLLGYDHERGAADDEHMQSRQQIALQTLAARQAQRSGGG